MSTGPDVKNPARLRRWSPAGATRVLAGAALGALCLSFSGTAAAAAQAGAGSAYGAPLPTPLATSVQAPGGTWATVAMGNLSQPLNTFWQLLFRPDGSASWSDQVEATAVATNGGIVLATGARSLLVGVRPSHDLTFSPLISTTDAGRSWSNGLLAEGLASRPQALAMGPDGTALAIVDASGGAEVLESSQSLSSWKLVATGRALAAGPGGDACEPGAVTAVAYLSGSAVVGTSCERPGEAGLFIRRGDGWQQAGPVLPSALGRAEVLALLPTSSGSSGTGSSGTGSSGTGLSALLGLSGPGRGSTEGPGGPSLVAAWTGAGGKWRTAAPFELGPGGRLVSFGGAPARGVFALVARADGRKELALAEASTSRWRLLPAPPVATATAAFGPGPTVDALAVAGTVLTVWTLSPGAQNWEKGQAINVPVQFGSSG